MPNKFEGVIGDHGEEFPIERIRLADNKKYMGSCAHDNSVHFWDVAHLFEEDGAEEDEDEEEDKANEEHAAEPVQDSEKVVDKAADSDSSEEEPESDDSDDSDDEKSQKQKRKRGKQSDGRNSKAARKPASGFFDDL